MDCNEYELDMVIQAAQHMTLKTKLGETKLNEMLSRANRVAEKIASMDRYKRFISDMEEVTVNGSRRNFILTELQRENRQIMALQDEYRQLRESSDDCINTMGEIVESHMEIRENLRSIKSENQIDDVNNVIMEISNNEFEIKLKKAALNINNLLVHLNNVKRQENYKLASALKRNKEYKSVFKYACLSNPSAAKILNSAISQILDEAEKSSQQIHEETATNVDDDLEFENSDETILNKTIEKRG